MAKTVGKKKKREKDDESPGKLPFGLSPERYRRMGKFLKPWGTPPTGVTFWVQLLTTAAIILIMIFKGVDASAELVISYGVPEYQQRQEPMNVAIGIIFILTCIVLLVGYLFTWWSERALQKQEAAAMAEKEAATKEAEEAEAAEAAEAEAAAEAEGQAEAGPSGGGDGPATAQLEAAAQSRLEAALQGVEAEARAQGCSEDEVRKRLAAVRGQHARHVQQQQAMMREAEEVRKTALAEGATPEQANARARQCVQWHQRRMQVEMEHQKQLQGVHREAVEKDKCHPSEVRRRIEAMQALQKAEVAAQDMVMANVSRARAAAMQGGLPPPEAERRVHEAARATEAEWEAARDKMRRSEMTKRREIAAAFAQRDDGAIAPEVREMLLGTVRIHGLNGRPELNGREGRAQGFVKDKGRLSVAVEGEGGGVVLLKPANLTLVADLDGNAKNSDADDGPPPLE